MAQNITLMGASFSDVPAVILPKTGGGDAKFVDIEDWSFMGSEVEPLGVFYDAEIPLSETTFPSWSASTTAKAILATENVHSFAADTANYEYFLHWTCAFHAAYNEGATLKAQVIGECMDAWQQIIRRPNSVANITSKSFNSNACVTVMSAPLLVYYNTGGSKTYTYSVSDGIYPALQAATFSNATTLTPTVTVKRPTINARCNSTYFATARKTDIDVDNSKIQMRCEGFRVPVRGMARVAYQNLINAYNKE